MKTIQFILSLMAVALFASCSADSDVLNELEDHNQLPGDEMVTLSLNLSAGTVATKGDNTTATDEEKKKTDATDDEKKINSCAVIVLGQNGIELFNSNENSSDVTINEENGTASVKLGTIKKQALTIYVAANLDDEDLESFYQDPENLADFTKNTKASALPKYNKVSVAKADCNEKINITVKQLTSRIDYPQVNEDWPGVDFKISAVRLQNAVTHDDVDEVTIPEDECAYVYPSENTTITVIGGYYEAGVGGANLYNQDFTFGPYNVKGKGNVNMAANNIYQLVMTVQPPKNDGEAPSALGLDWFIAEMLKGGSINDEAGLN